MQELPRVVGVGHGFGPPQHVDDLQILHHQHVIALDQRAGLFVVKVLALVGDLAMPSRHSLPPPLTVLRTALGALQSLLRRGEPVRRGPAPARIVDVLTVAGGGETRDPDVDTGLAAGAPAADWSARHHRTAPASSAARWRLTWIVFTRPCHAAVQVDLDLSDALQIHPLAARAASGHRHRLWATPRCRTGPCP